MKNILKTAVVFIGLAVLASADVRAGDHDYSTKHALIYKQVTPEQFASLPDSAPVAFMCPQCKSVEVLVKRDLAAKPGHGSETVAIPTHACPGCGGKFVVKPGSKETTWVHSCKHCGDHDVICCAAMEGGHKH